ncbi:MAG: alpha-galactosidase, partial [Treponema sp.]|nr:alpha-galactosidase [Treponema sp.]
GRWPDTINGKKTQDKLILKGQFIIYFRWKQTYLVLASTGPIVGMDAEVLPPVQFFVDREAKTVAATIYADGKKWKPFELMSQITVFTASNYFALKDGIKKLFGGIDDKRFSFLSFLNTDTKKIKCAGWESWYNHYSNITEELILKDLDALDTTDNLIKLEYLDKNHNIVFQVDDGWEKALGQWQAHSQKFPSGMQELARKIEEKGYIPGLWIAPFIIDYRSDFAQQHKDWILKDERRKPLYAGFNPNWGAKWGKYQPAKANSFFCLDLSRDDVLEYLDKLMEIIIEEWGFRYIKLDFLYAGMLNGRFAQGGAAYQWYDRAIKKITRRWVNSQGQSVGYLGCGMPFESSFATLPLSRIGPDTKEAWDDKLLEKLHYPARPGAKPNLISTLGHAFWDQSIYINDPDVVFLRTTNISLSDGEKELIALINKLFASQIMHSDDPIEFNINEKEFTEKIAGYYEALDGQEFGLETIESDMHVIFSRNGKFCGFINMSEKPFTMDKDELIKTINYQLGLSLNAESVELKPVVESCLNAGDLFTSERHSISVFEITEESESDSN